MSTGLLHWTYRPKRCGNNNKDEDNSLKTINDKNHQASSQKFRQLNLLYYAFLIAALPKNPALYCSFTVFEETGFSKWSLSSAVIFGDYGPPHMAEQKHDDQLEHTYSSSVRIWDVTLKTCQRQ